MLMYGSWEQNEFIELIENLQKNRSLNIKTPYGNTENFTPEQGLAQGDLLSPLLWNIFYFLKHLRTSA